MASSAWTTGEKFDGFTWTSSQKKTVAAARKVLTEMRSKGGKSAIDWNGLEWLPNGVYLSWRASATHAAGHNWFRRVLGDLAPADERFCGDSWKVAGGELVVDSSPPVADVGSPCLQAVEVASAPPLPQLPAWVCDFPAMKLARDGTALAKSAGCYKIAGPVGKGRFGVVKAAEREGTQVVIKEVDKADAMVELLCLERCRGAAHIVQLLDVIALPFATGFVLERWGCDLGGILMAQASAPLTTPQIRGIIADVAKGLGYLHGVGLVHADLKPANVLAKLDGDNYRCKVSDLGACQEVLDNAFVCCSRPGFLASITGTAKQSAGTEIWR